MPMKLAKSSPAQKPRPSPESTTARSDGSVASSRPVPTRASNIAGSRAFSFSGRFSRTSASGPVGGRRSKIAGALPLRSDDSIRKLRE